MMAVMMGKEEVSDRLKTFFTMTGPMTWEYLYTRHSGLFSLGQDITNPVVAIGCAFIYWIISDLQLISLVALGEPEMPLWYIR